MPRHRFTRLIQSRVRAHPQPMRTRRIPNEPLRRIQPRRPSRRRKRTRRVVIEINHAPNLFDPRAESSLFGLKAPPAVDSFGQSMQTVLYKRATFVTHLPVGHLYTASHNWISK